MLYIAAGFGLAILAVAVGIPIVMVIDPLAYPDIRLVCHELVDSGAQCSAGALEAGSISAAGLIVAAIVAIGLRPTRLQPAVPIRHEIVLPLALATVVALVVLATLRAPLVPFVSREQEITASTVLVSIVNLGWPLLLQLAAIAPRIEIRLGYLAALATLLCLSPFRAALLSVAVFGVMLPLVELLIRREAARTLEPRRLVMGLSAIVLAGGVIAAIILSQTAERTLTPMDGALESSPVSTSFGKLSQRLSYPLYQAYFAAAVAQVEELPSAVQEIAAKFRLGNSRSLNHHLYERIYNHETVGEMTSLYYGEGAARTSLPPFLWVVAAPMLYVLAWLLLRGVGADVGVLAGIAIWRGSLGGAFSVLPAFVIQSLVVLCLCRLARERATTPRAAS